MQYEIKRSEVTYNLTLSEPEMLLLYGCLMETPKFSAEKALRESAFDITDKQYQAVTEVNEFSFIDVFAEMITEGGA